jgi:hypothetical protein
LEKRRTEKQSKVGSTNRQTSGKNIQIDREA